MSEAKIVKFDEPIQFYQSSWDIRATKNGEDRTANLFMDSRFKCPDGCELDAKNLPLTCPHGWRIEEWREPNEGE